MRGEEEGRGGSQEHRSTGVQEERGVEKRMRGEMKI